MAVRKGKAAGRGREFLIEILAIVIGILIALAVDQSVGAMRERGEAREARAAIVAEMQENLNRVAYRQGQQACVDARLNEIAMVLAAWTEGRPPPVDLAIGDPGPVPLVQQRWQANLNSGRFSRQSGDEQGEQAAFYTRLAVLDEIGRREHDTWSELRTLELGPGVVRLDLRPSLVLALQAARTLSNDTRQLGRLVVETGKSAGLTPQPFQGAAIAGSTCNPLVPSNRAATSITPAR